MKKDWWRRRVFLRLLAMVGLSALGFLIIGLFLARNRFNPMLLVSLDTFTMVNDSGEDLWVTPIGIVESSNKYKPLPRYRSEAPPATYTGPATNIYIARGGSAKITYDWEDIQFTHVLVRTANGEVLILDTDPGGSLHECSPPQKLVYRIPPMRELRPAPVELLPCLEGTAVDYRPRR